MGLSSYGGSIWQNIYVQFHVRSQAKWPSSWVEIPPSVKFAIYLPSYHLSIVPVHCLEFVSILDTAVNDLLYCSSIRGTVFINWTLFADMDV
jgi:hypothetical protein